jgi:hypothetical protein
LGYVGGQGAIVECNSNFTVKLELGPVDLIRRGKHYEKQLRPKSPADIVDVANRLLHYGSSPLTFGTVQEQIVRDVPGLTLGGHGQHVDVNPTLAGLLSERWVDLSGVRDRGGAIQIAAHQVIEVRSSNERTGRDLETALGLRQAMYSICYIIVRANTKDYYIGYIFSRVQICLCERVQRPCTTYREVQDLDPIGGKPLQE